MANNERGRVVLIFAAVAVAAGAAGFYFVKVYRPREALAAARTDVQAWDVRYAGARTCLLGATPGSSITREALAIRELSPDPWDRGQCTPLVSHLARDAANSGVDAVEHAWDELDAAATHAAQAFATHVAASTTIGVLHDPLPDALDALDAARGKLFAAVELPVPAATGKPLTVAQLVPIADGSDPVIDLGVDADALLSAHGGVYYGRTKSRVVQVTLVPGGAPVVVRRDPLEFRGVPEGSWAAIRTPTGVRIGAVDAEGAMASGEHAATDLALADAAVLAVSTASAGALVVFGNGTKLVVAHATASGVTAEPAIAVFGEAAVTDGDGTVGVAWLTPKETYQSRIWRAGVAQDITETTPPAVTPAAMCLTGDRLVFGGVGEGRLLGCTPDGWVEYLDGSPRFAVCTPTCREVALAGAPAVAPVAVVGGKLMTFVSFAGVLAVWKEGGGRAFFALPHEVRLEHLHTPRNWAADSPAPMPELAPTDGKAVDLIATDGRAYVIVRVPVGS